MLNYNEIKDWENKAIDAKVGELRRELFEMRMQKSTSGTEKPHRFKELKKDIAKLLTAKNSRS